MNPVFVIGFPRSGTTLLLHLLMSSGEFPTYRFSESHFFSHCYRRYGTLTKEKNRAELMAELAAREWFSGTDVSPEQLLERVGNRYASYEAYFECFMELVAESQDKTRWLEKTPWHLHYTPEIRKALPAAKFLIIVRDPRDVVLSIAKYGWTGSQPNRMLRAAIAWNWAMTLIHDDFSVDKGSHLVVRYEDLVTDTEKVLERINHLLGLNISMATLDQPEFGVMAASNSSYGSSTGGISSMAVGRWREKMPAELVAQMNFVLANALRDYGYDHDEPNLTLLTRLKLASMISAYGAGKRLRQLLFPVLRR